jgi:hypothetical protein
MPWPSLGPELQTNTFRRCCGVAALTVVLTNIGAVKNSAEFLWPFGLGKRRPARDALQRKVRCQLARLHTTNEKQ